MPSLLIKQSVHQPEGRYDPRWNDLDYSNRKLDENSNASSRQDNSSFSDIPSLGSCTLHSTQSTLSGSFNSSREIALTNITSNQRTIRAQNGTISTKHSSNAISAAIQSFSNWSKSRQERQQTRIEKDLMRQLEFLQDDKVRCIQELQLKLSQRETAIETLETALRIMDSTVQSLRNEIEEMKSQKRSVRDKLRSSLSPSRRMLRGEGSKSRCIPMDTMAKPLVPERDRRSSMVVLIPVDDTARKGSRLQMPCGKSRRKLAKAKSLSPTRSSETYTPTRSCGQLSAIDDDPLFL
jgi:hypothetical protein